MSDHKDPRFIEAHKATRALWAFITVIFFAAALVVRGYEGDLLTVDDSTLHFTALWTAFALMWISAAYFIYLAWGSLGRGSFPGPDSRLPVRCRRSYGATAIAYRIVMVLAAICLVAFPIGVLRYIK